VLPDEASSKRIAFEISQISRELKIIDRLNAIRKNDNLDEIQARAAASSLHSVYNGIEKVVLLVLKDRGKSIPKGEAWHSEALDAARENGIISDALEADLRNFMGFRHFYRHAYGFMIDTELLSPLLEGARAAVDRLREELGLSD
jgi:hypothetical protein